MEVKTYKRLLSGISDLKRIIIENYACVNKTRYIISKTNMDKYECARPVHPGEILKEEIEYRGISQGKLATQMGISYKMLNLILNERRPLSTQTAMLFEAALGIDSDLLMRMQLKYNSRMARRDKSFSERLANIRKATAML
jgi:addiction module HigA family antidote